MDETTDAFSDIQSCYIPLRMMTRVIVPAMTTAKYVTRCLETPAHAQHMILRQSIRVCFSLSISSAFYLKRKGESTKREIESNPTRASNK
jgi:hypothetical protein